MDMQLDLFGGGAPKLVGTGRSFPTHRWYFTLLPPPVIAQDMEYFALRMSRRFGVRRPVRAARIHASLHGIGEGDEIPADDLDAALEVGEAIRRPAFDVTFDRLMTLDGGGKGGKGRQFPTVLSCSTRQREIQALHADLRREMLRRGPKDDSSSILPHVTLWYDTGSVPEQPLSRPFRWRVRQFFLVRTTLGEARPECLGEWRLGR